MKLLLDENLSPRVAGVLDQAGHVVAHVYDVGLGNVDDGAILAAAAREGRVIVTADTDFGALWPETGCLHHRW